MPINIRAKNIENQTVIENFNDGSIQMGVGVPHRKEGTSMTLPEIVFVSSNADRNSPLSVDREFNRVRERLLTVDATAVQRLHHWPDVRLDQIASELLRRTTPVILHFSGHGDPAGGLTMSNRKEEADVVNGPGFASFVSQFPMVESAVLNACYSDVLGKEIAAAGKNVIGMTTQISDDAAILFAPTFYEALARGQSFTDAFEICRALLHSVFPDEAGTIRLRVAGRL